MTTRDNPGRHEPEMAPPTLSFVMRIEAECEVPFSGGPNRLGERIHVPIMGGPVVGPEIRGAICPGGSDWALRRSDGAAIVDAHYSIVTDDGIPIYIQNRGIRIATPDIVRKLQGEDFVDPRTYYFRSTPVFDVPSGRLEFLNDKVFTASCFRFRNVTTINVFAVE